VSPAETRRGNAPSRGVTQLSLFDSALSPANEAPGSPPSSSPVTPAPPQTPGRLPDGASLWAVSFVGDARGPRERFAWASARYRAHFGRAHAFVAVPLAELDDYRAAGVEAVGDGRLAKGCLYLLHPTGDPEPAIEEAT